MEKCKVEVYQNNFRITTFFESIFRGKVKIQILDGLIRISTNRDGNWMNTGKPFEFESPEIRKQEVTHMYVGAGKKTKGNIKVMGYKYV